MSSKVVILSGPTASGKTSLSIEIAKALNGEIISCDSMQVYCGLDIGTAKITEIEKEGIPHHLLDIRYPNEAYSVADFQKDARQKIAEITQRGKTPILVGGTGLYIQATVFDYIFEERAALDYERYDEMTNEALYSRLQEVDIQSSLIIEKNNRRRVMHALAIAEQTCETKSAGEAKQEQKLLYEIFPLALMPEREKLYERINQRVDKMFQDGLMAEVIFFNTKYEFASQVKRAIGYKEPLAYLDDDMSFDAMIDALKQNTRRFAKRQMTWIRNQKITYKQLDLNVQVDTLVEEIQEFLNK